VRQQLLPIELNLEMLFNNWQQTQSTQPVLNTLQKDTNTQIIYLFGAKGLGKTHLLQATVHQSLELDKKTIYLDLKKDIDSEIWQQLETFDVICLDNIDNLNTEQQVLLFNLYNKVVVNKLRLIVSAKVSPKNLNYNLVDLKTRLSLSLIFALAPYNDDDLKNILYAKVKEQKLLINDNIFNYLLNTFERDLSHLLIIIEKIKHYAIETKQKVSLPLVKKVTTSV
jgi:DnaA family protein